MTAKPKGRWTWLAGGSAGLVAVVGLLLLGGAWSMAGKSRATPLKSVEKPAVAVTVEPVTPRKVQRLVRVVGTLFGRDELAITPKVDGRIVKICCDVGDLVKPGELLAELDSTDYRLAAAEAQRALDLELAKLGLKELPGREFDLRGLPAVLRAAATERNAGLRRERLARLGLAGTGEERDLADKDHSVAQAEFRQTLLDAETTLASARLRQAALETAQQRLRDTRIVAPPGVGPTEYAVCKREVAQGEMATAAPGMSTTLFRLIVDRPLKLRATVPERHRGEIKLDQTVALEVESHPREKFQGVVSRINPSIDRTSRTFQVEILIPNEERRLSAGSFAKAAIQTRIDPSALTVPEESIVSFAGVTKVFAVKDGKATAVLVKPGVTLEIPAPGGHRTWIEVEAESDLPTGWPVVTSGQSQLAEGTPVRIR